MSEDRLTTDDLARRGAPAEAEAEADPADEGASANGDSQPPQLFDGAQSAELRGRWSDIQTGFVDEPRHAVEEADALVADLMRRLAESFSHERQNLEGQWDRGDQVSTEDLRVALQRYRGFFDRLLAA